MFAVKPNPPESVLVRQLEGHSKRLIVSWNFPLSWPLDDGFPLVFQIRYRPQGSMYWSEVSKLMEAQSQGCKKENTAAVSHTTLFIYTV